MNASTAPSVRRLRSTARAMLPFPEPESWLDVQTGDADFPEAARTFFPYTAFDGLDLTPRVVHAQAIERLEEAHLGRLTDPQITTRLRARYDVVSLLNQSPGPEGLRAALAVLRPGGHLLVESPDDPRAELESQGCTIVTTTRRSAHVPERVTTRLTRVLPPRATGPLIPTARALDHTLALLLAGTRYAKTYRVIARKNAEADNADAGSTDTGRLDAGRANAGRDADIDRTDAASADAGSADARSVDTGRMDAARADAVGAESGNADTGSTGTACAGPAERPAHASAP
ncbi:hypothetical protein [Streptomyces sp. NBC_00285]|uniref:hypothetical protein n=1 Tax=Streptomyces sp. NBC_00285 TaxID=2975700 RepID=UPI002E2BD0BE|nr:hypothetical protein [Streptomyces sp. NBC_00285]